VAQSHMRREPVMRKPTRFVGLDVHADSIAVAVAEEGRAGEVRSLGIIPNRRESVRQLVKRLDGPKGLRLCYEAGPTGFALYWHLVELGVECQVVAPTLVPVKAGDRVKTDRRDATKLARSYRAGELTPVFVPDKTHEALRDLVRCREAAKKDQLRARHRLTKFLLRAGRHRPATMTAWTGKHMSWVAQQRFDEPAQQITFNDYRAEIEHVANRIDRLEQAIEEAAEKMPPAMRAVVEALQALRGVAALTAVTIVAEAGPLSRFQRPKQLMGYSGAVPSEHSSGASVRRGRITKTGNSHLRRVVIEAAWAYRHPPRVSADLRRRQHGLDPAVVEVAWKAQHRLHRRYLRLQAKGKPRQHIITAVGRELLGFVWAIAVEAERRHASEPKRLAA
jgi:transposase